MEVAEDIITICEHPLNFEAILKQLFDKYSLTMTYEQYVLVGSTVKSYLAWLKDKGKIITYFEDNILLWKSA